MLTGKTADGETGMKKFYKMKIAFIVVGNGDRLGDVNGESIRYYGVTSSGTDSSAILVAEYLAKLGHEVVFSGEGCKPNTTSYGVKYTNINFEGIEDKNFDILVTSLWFGAFKELPVKINKALVYWCHLAWMYSIREMEDYARSNNIQLGVVHISDWEKSFNEPTVIDMSLRLGRAIKTAVIPNAIVTDVAKEIIAQNISKIRHKTIFHGQWSRGGPTALQIVKELGWDPDKDFFSLDYLRSDSRGRADKRTLFTILASCEYFIFPSFTHGRLVYKDTFSCAVAEALAMGAIVLAYPLGALPQYYDDYCVWVDYPDGINLEKFNTEKVSEEPKFGQTEKFVKKVQEIEANPELKSQLLYRGSKYILDSFNPDIVGSKWEAYLTQFLKNEI